VKVAVANTTPLIGLAQIGQFDLLRMIFDVVYIAPSVYAGIHRGAGRPGSAEVQRGLAQGWLQIASEWDRSCVEALKIELGEGEAETIGLANAMRVDAILLDERKGRAVADRMGLPVLGTVGLLLLAKRQGANLNLADSLHRLKAVGFRISDALVEKLLTDHSSD